MAIANVGTPYSYAGTPNATPAAGTHRATEPAGTSPGNVVWAIWITQGFAGNSIGLPAGWTTIQNWTTSGGNFFLAFGYIVRGASAPSYDFTHSPASVTYCELVIWVQSGVDPAVIDNLGTPVGPALQATMVDPPSAVANFAADWVQTMVIDWFGGPTGGWGAPSGYTRIATSGTGASISVAVLVPGATGTFDPGPFTGADGNEWKWANTLTILAATTGGAGASSAGSSSTATGGSPPQNTAAPVASGTAQAGQTVSATQGTWSNSPTGYTYQWQRRLP